MVELKHRRSINLWEIFAVELTEEVHVISIDEKGINNKLDKTKKKLEESGYFTEFAIDLIISEIRNIRLEKKFG